MTSRERIVIYGVSDLPDALSERLPTDAPARRCLFYIARQGSPVVRALYDAMEEPPMEEVDAALSLSGLILRVAARTRVLADTVRPDEVGDDPVYLGTYTVGFHTEEASHVRAFLGARADLVPLATLLEDVLILDVRDRRGPSRWLAHVSGGDAAATPCADPGWFVMERPSYPVTVRGVGGWAVVERPPPGGVASSTLGPGPEFEPLDEERLTAERAAAAVDAVVGDLEAPGGTRIAVLTRLRGPAERRGVFALVLEEAEDGEVLRSFYSSHNLFPRQPISEGRYVAFLEGARDAWLARDGAPLSLPDWLDLALLEVPGLQTREEFQRAIVDPLEGATHLAPAGLEATYPEALTALPPRGRGAFWSLLPEVALARRIGEPIALMGELPEAWCERVAEAWASWRLQHDAPLYTIEVEILEAAQDRLGTARTHAAAERALDGDP